MEELSLTTPSILFSAISLIMLAYTNRFLSYAQLVRTLHSEHLRQPSEGLSMQLANLRKRLYLTRAMQGLGIGSLIFCLLSTIMIYVDWQMTGVWLFGIALLLLVVSLVVSMIEIMISTKALELQINQADTKTKESAN